MRLTDEQESSLLLELARDAAANTEENHDYLPKTKDDKLTFQPHAWVLTAMAMAFAWGYDEGTDSK